MSSSCLAAKPAQTRAVTRKRDSERASGPEVCEHAQSVRRTLTPLRHDGRLNATPRARWFQRHQKDILTHSLPPNSHTHTHTDIHRPKQETHRHATISCFSVLGRQRAAFIQPADASDCFQLLSQSLQTADPCCPVCHSAATPRLLFVLSDGLAIVAKHNTTRHANIQLPSPARGDFVVVVVVGFYGFWLALQAPPHGDGKRAK